MNFKKNIILSSVDKNNEVKGVFTIEKNSLSCTGILRIYNYKELSNNYCLGIMVNGIPLQKIAMGKEIVFCKVELPTIIDFNSKISVIVVSNDGVNATPIVFGSTQNINYQDSFNIFTTRDINETIEKEVKSQIPNITTEENINIEKEINLNNFASASCEEKDCEKCVYKKTFYDEECFETQKEMPSLEAKHNKTFFEIVSPKIEELFEQNAPCEELNALMPSSKWVSVNIDEFEKYYIGIIYENNNPKFIAYAVKGVYSPLPPKELEPTSQWLPLDSYNSEGEGYWLMFQDALTGE